ncbi:hypothetical protein DSM104443_01026 [Usitatibacter rugosus]|uniref:PIN domain-containing protein n=1 Tax=Usitatibacter rugosus TaxID=2732067 RepID=A0A6M4GSE1_9PROT|nr:PIN domain-containing protein [Usitatibacter rugosus]QJR09975.1 hypothetical protein DSM104443_01026 [Usitatibacter rugosus]
MRIFLDANVLFSAAKSDGAVRQLLGLLAQSGCASCVDAYVVEEARRNLAAKFPASIPYLNELLTTVEVIPTRAQPAGQATYGLPEKDRPVMAAAIAGHCDILVTGDKAHFAPLYGKRIEGVEILSPAMLGLKVLTRRS